MQGDTYAILIFIDFCRQTCFFIFLCLIQTDKELHTFFILLLPVSLDLPFQERLEKEILCTDVFSPFLSQVYDILNLTWNLCWKGALFPSIVKLQSPWYEFIINKYTLSIKLFTNFLVIHLWYKYNTPFTSRNSRSHKTHFLCNEKPYISGKHFDSSLKIISLFPHFTKTFELEIQQFQDNVIDIF